MKMLKILCIMLCAGALIFSTNLTYGAPGGSGKSNGKANGKDNNNGKAKGKQNNGKANANKSNNGNNKSNQLNSGTQTRSKQIVDGQTKSLIRKYLPKGTKLNWGGTNTKDNNKNRLGKENKGKARGILKAFEKSKWSFHPKDDRGQGNMGKPDMRDPFGFDKDSGREGSERGRPIRSSEDDIEAILNLAEICGIDFPVMDATFIYFQNIIDRWTNYAEAYPQYADYYYAKIAAVTEEFIDPYYQRDYDIIQTNTYLGIVNYSLDFTVPEEFDGTNLLITTTITSLYDYDYTGYQEIFNTGPIIDYQYDAGEVVYEETQEVTLGTDDTYSFSYDPETTVAGDEGFYGELAVTITDVDSGESYTTSYDRSLYFYRCPYGKVANAKTGESIVGAKITVHFADGSKVPLDKASNPTANNPQITDATGRYGFVLETNRKYYLTASAPGYEDYRSETFTERWHVLREDVVLNPIN